MSLRARMTWIEDAFDDGIRDPADGAVRLADLAGRVAARGEVDLALRLLWAAAQRCFWSEPGDGVRRRVAAAADAVPCDPRDPRLLAVLAFAAPIDRGAAVVERLRPAADARFRRARGAAARQRGDGGRRLRRGAGRCTPPPPRSCARRAGSGCWPGPCSARPTARCTSATSPRRSRPPTRRPGWPGRPRSPTCWRSGRAYEAATAALRGDDDEAVAPRRRRPSGPRCPVAARPVLATVQLARGLSALGDGRYSDAFDEFRRIYDPADPAFHLAHRCYGDLLRQRVRRVRRPPGRGPRASSRRWRRRGCGRPSPALHAGLRLRPRRAGRPTPTPSARFEALLVDVAGWPFARSRAQLAYGAWLRRRRRPADSRPHLRAARDAFDALGLTPWGDRARQELRASGETSRRRTPDAPRPAHPAGAADRPAGRRRPDQPGDRPAALPVPPDGQHAPVPDLPEARGHLPRRPRRGDRVRRRTAPSPDASGGDATAPTRSARDRRPARPRPLHPRPVAARHLLGRLDRAVPARPATTPSAPGWPGDADTVEEARAQPGQHRRPRHRRRRRALRRRSSPSCRRKPILVGHSFGGMIAQKLLGQDLARRPPSRSTPPRSRACCRCRCRRCGPRCRCSATRPTGTGPSR